MCQAGVMLSTRLCCGARAYRVYVWQGARSSDSCGTDTPTYQGRAWYGGQVAPLPCSLVCHVR